MPPTLKYPYKWGRDVVTAFVEKYARGTYFLAFLLDISPGEVRMMLTLTLCRGLELRFRSLKRVIKMLEDYTKADLVRFSPADRKQLYKWIVVDAENAELDEKSEEVAIDNWTQRRLC